MTTIKMRNDITGLRALAVLPVLLFHSKIPFIPGGFLGVDLFFVISGFLITGDIIRRLEAGSFSFISFYDRRARRILPALLFVIFWVLLLAPVFMVPYDIKNIGQSAFASIFAANNILLWFTSGYWSHAAEFKPLYHTWSLGVEEQYYFIIPVMLLLSYKLFKRFSSFYIVIFLVLLASFIHSYLAVNKEYNFLIILTRAWELMMGGLLAAYLIRNQVKPNRIGAAIGLILVLTAYFFPYLISENQAFVNIIPVFGAFLIIAFSDEEKNLVGRLLSLKPMVFIGLISYSIYLWHQPLIAFYRLASEYAPNPYMLAAFSFVSIPLAYISWRLVENPARNFQIMPAKRFYPLLTVLVLIAAGVGLTMHKTYGFQEHFQEYSYDGDPQKYVDHVYKYQHISAENEGKQRLLVLGNSFARDFINMIEEASLSELYEIVYEPAGCSVTGERLRSLLGNSNYVILASNWAQTGDPDTVFANLQSCLTRLEPELNGRQLLVLGAKNFGWNNNFVKQLSADKIFTARTRPLESVLQFNQLASSSIDGYIDIMGVLLDENAKVPVFTDDARFITYDTNHLTKPGAKYLGSLLFQKTELKQLTAPKN